MLSNIIDIIKRTNYSLFIIGAFCIVAAVSIYGSSELVTIYKVGIILVICGLCLMALARRNRKYIESYKEYQLY
ncbi:hypothetical protein, partial [Elizabethkingia meningoseptica]